MACKSWPVTDQVRRLLVMRHSKAEAAAASDHARRLTKRGAADAAEAGTWARSAGVLPDHVFVSSAARTRETWAAFAATAGLDDEPEFDPGLYPAGTDAALEIVRTAPAEAQTVMVIGHNPTMAHLVHLLDDGSADPDAFAEISTGFPTSAIAVLEVAADWADLAFGAARITAMHVGRGHVGRR
jgi:phosphohistidine phosphatase